MNDEVARIRRLPRRREPMSGSIAQTLAQARASLKEPSRPFTPAATAASRDLFNTVGTDRPGSSRPTSGGYDSRPSPSGGDYLTFGGSNGGGVSSNQWCAEEAGDQTRLTDGSGGSGRSRSGRRPRIGSRGGGSSASSGRAPPRPETEPEPGEATMDVGQTSSADADHVIELLESALSRSDGCDAAGIDTPAVRSLIEHFESAFEKDAIETARGGESYSSGVVYERAFDVLFKLFKLGDTELALDASRVALRLIALTNAHELSAQRIAVCKQMFQVRTRVDTRARRAAKSQVASLAARLVLVGRLKRSRSRSR